MATGRRAERGRVSDEVTSREEGEKKEGWATPRKQVKRKPVTEWAGMTDWGMAGRKWKRGSGEGDNWWEVAKKEQQFGSRSIGIRCIAFADNNTAWSKPLFAFLAQSPIMIGSLSWLAASSP